MNKKSMVLGLLPLIMVTNSALGIAPSLARISQYFGASSAPKVQLIVSLGALFSLIGALVASRLQKSLPQKMVLVLGGLLLSCGLLPVVVEPQLTLLLVVAVFTGSGGGVLTATVPAVISQHFTGSQRGRVLGYKTSFQGLGTMAITYLGGLLAVDSWQSTYLIFALPLVAVVLGLLFLPQGVQSQNEPVRGPVAEGRISGPVFLLFGLAVCLTLLSGSLSNNMALHADHQGLGDASLAGLALACQSLGVILAGFGLPLVSRFISSWTLVASFLLTSLGLGLLTFVSTQVTMVLGAFIFGLGYGLILTRLLLLVTTMATTALVPKALGLISAAMSLGFALSPVVFNWSASFLSGDQAKGSFISSFVLSLLLLVLLAVSQFEKKALDGP